MTENLADGEPSTRYLHFAVVVLNWNGRRHLQHYLPSVLATRYPNWTCVVVDNASTDDSVNWIKSLNHNALRLIELDENRGYTGGYNLALAGIEADVYVLLNSDVAVSENWLVPLNQAFQSSPQVLAVQPKILADKHPTRFEYAGAGGGMVDRLGYPFCAGRVFSDLEEDRGQYDMPRTVFWVSGACMAVRSTAFREAGGLDARYFAHMEEIDLCWRLQRLGGRLLTAPGSVVYHLGGGSLAYGSPRKTFLNFRNSLYTLTKNLHPQELFVKVFSRLILDGLAALYFVVRGSPADFGAVLRAHLHYYQVLPELLQERRRSRQPFLRLEQMQGVWQGSIWPYLALGASSRKRMRQALGDFVAKRVYNPSGQGH